MDVSTPQQPSYGQQMADTLTAQEQAQTGTGAFSSLGPLINLEQNPQYGQGAWANLSLRTIDQLINGTPGGPQTTTTNSTTPGGFYDAAGNLVSNDPNYAATAPGISGRGKMGGSFGAPGGGALTWRPATTTPQTTTTNVAATPGLLALNGQIIDSQAQQQAGAMTTQRQSDIADVMNLGPKSMAAVNNADPGSAQLLAMMTGQATNDLALGSNLSAPQTRTVTQAVRAQNQGMLGGTGNAGTYAQALGLSAYGQQLQANRRAYAGSTLGTRSAFYGNPFQNILNRTGTTNPGAAIAQAQGISGSSFNPYTPESQYAANIYGNNQQTAMAGSAASASANAGLISGALQGLGSGAGALSKM